MELARADQDNEQEFHSENILFATGPLGAMKSIVEISPFHSLTGTGIGESSMSVMAFHEKAGRSQVGSFVFSLDKVFLFPPSGHCRHASIRTLEERFHFARCMLGVLVSAGAAI